MKNGEKHDFNFWVWFWSICITAAIIVGIQNFDEEQIVLCCLVLLPAVIWDIIFIIECFLEVKCMINKHKENK